MDPLLARAQLVLEENACIREMRRLLQAQFDREREQLRLSIIESAMTRAEIKAYRDDKG